MTTTVLTATSTRTAHREPLKLIDMATSQGRPASSSSIRGERENGKATRASSRLNAKENPVETEGDAQKTTQGRPTRHTSKRNAAEYDEDIGGFQFSRATIKKLKSAPPVNGDAVDKPVVHSPRRGRPPKSHTAQPTAEIEVEGTRATVKTAKPRGRPKRNSIEFEHESARQPVRHHEEPPFPIEKPAKKGRPAKSKPSMDMTLRSPEPSVNSTSKIALPLADTPVIRRNKEMREGRGGKGPRRNSLGMRGRRASSLIDSGVSNALPHKEVPTSEFYKHIASDGLPEPRRMRQLMTWCATRALDDKPTGSRTDDDSARLAARVIQEELLQDFSNKSELTNWFAREDEPTPTVVVKRPNPKNLQNAEKINELEEQIKRLQQERHTLNALLQPHSIPRLDSPAEYATRDGSDNKSFSAIDQSILDPSQLSILTTLQPDPLRTQPAEGSSEEQISLTSTTKSHLQPMSPAAVSRRLSRITASMAPTLDAFASGLHDIDIYRSTADRLSHQILKFCSERLEERDRSNASNSDLFTNTEQTREDENHANINRDSQQMPLRTRQARQQKEDISFVLGALSRVERR